MRTLAKSASSYSQPDDGSLPHTVVARERRRISECSVSRPRLLVLVVARPRGAREGVVPQRVVSGATSAPPTQHGDAEGATGAACHPLSDACATKLATR